MTTSLQLFLHVVDVIFLEEPIEYFAVFQKSIDKMECGADPFWLADQGITAKKYPILISFDKAFIGERIFFHEGFQGGRIRVTIWIFL